MIISRRLLDLRKQKKLSQYRLAELSGVSQSFISDIENGNKTLTVDTLEKICIGLGISLAGFFSENTDIGLSEDLNNLLQEAQKLTPPQIIKLTEFIKTLIN